MIEWILLTICVIWLGGMSVAMFSAFKTIHQEIMTILERQQPQQ